MNDIVSMIIQIATIIIVLALLGTCGVFLKNVFELKKRLHTELFSKLESIKQLICLERQEWDTLRKKISADIHNDMAREEALVDKQIIMLGQVTFLWENILQDPELNEHLVQNLDALKGKLNHLKELDAEQSLSKTTLSELEKKLLVQTQTIAELKQTIRSYEDEQGALTEQITALNLNHGAAVEQLEKTQQQAISELKIAHRNELDELNNEHGEALRRQDLDCRTKLNQLEKKLKETELSRDEQSRKVCAEYELLIPAEVRTLFGPITPEDHGKLLALYGFVMALNASDNEVIRKFKLFDADLQTWGESISADLFRQLRERLQFFFNTHFSVRELEVRWPAIGERYDNRRHDSITESGNTIVKVKSACIYHHGQIEVKSLVETS